MNKDSLKLKYYALKVQWNKGFTDHYLLIIGNIVFTALDGRRYFNTAKEAKEAGNELKKKWKQRLAKLNTELSEHA